MAARVHQHAHSDGNTVIQNWTYTFDEVGNLLSRARADQVADAPSTETFTYDALNRVRTASMTVGANATSPSAYDYDGNGNLLHKDGHSYTYGGTCRGPGLSGSGLHQVCSIDSGPKFVYDAAGNLTSGGGRSVAYNAHNKVVQITSAAGTAQFMYGADDNRVVQAATSGGATSRTVYVGLAGTGKSLYERTTTGATVQHTNFIYAGGAHGGNAFAVRVLANDGTTTATRYFSFDHLGSTTAVSDERGHIATATGVDTELLGYDPWGARRNPDGQPASPSTFPSSAGHRDFTGQEAISAVGLINMNGRVYDPVLARFLSPDPDLQTPGDLQDYNRYSYVLNNPLRYTDPTGNDAFSDLGKFFSDPFNDVMLAMDLAACVAAPGVGCIAVGALQSLAYANTALAFGAPFDKTALNLSISFSISLLSSGVVGAAVGPGANPIASLVAGSASAAVTTAISDAVAGKSLGWDVFWSAALSAAQGAATYGLQQVVALSQASAEVQGGGSGAAQVERGELGGGRDPHDEVIPGTSGNPRIGSPRDLTGAQLDELEEVVRWVGEESPSPDATLRKPGDTVYGAPRDFTAEHAVAFIRNNGTGLLRDGPTTVAASGVDAIDVDTGSMNKRVETWIAAAHTHFGPGGDQFSVMDTTLGVTRRIDVWLVAPAGGIKLFDPRANAIYSVIAPGQLFWLH